MNKEKIIKENIETYNRFKANILEDDWRFWGNVEHMKCVSCGGYCTSNNFMFYEKDPRQVLCYDCQQKETSEEEAERIKEETAYEEQKSDYEEQRS